jgi:hypothetical protein
MGSLGEHSLLFPHLNCNLGFQIRFVLIRDVTYIDGGVKKLLIIGLTTISLLQDAAHQPFKHQRANQVSFL